MSVASSLVTNEGNIRTSSTLFGKQSDQVSILNAHCSGTEGKELKAHRHTHLV